MPPEAQSVDSLDGEAYSRRNSLTARPSSMSSHGPQERHRQENRTRKIDGSLDSNGLTESRDVHHGARPMSMSSALPGPLSKPEWRQQSHPGNANAWMKRDWRSDSIDGLDVTGAGMMSFETTSQSGRMSQSTNLTELGTDDKPHQLQPAEQRKKHPLEQPWCLFVLQDGEHRTQESWNDSQIGVHEFETVEDFWCMMTHIHPPSHLGVSDYSLFKKGVKPAWEDAAVAQGGRWVARLPTRLRSLDDLWEYVSMAMIGETLHVDHSRSICGAVVSVRPRSLKLSLWLSLREPEGAKSIGAEFQAIVFNHLEVKDRKTCELVFQSFKDNIEYRLSPTGAFTQSQPTAHGAGGRGSFADAVELAGSGVALQQRSADGHLGMPSDPLFNALVTCATNEGADPNIAATEPRPAPASVPQVAPPGVVTQQSSRPMGSYDETVRSYLDIGGTEAPQLYPTRAHDVMDAACRYTTEQRSHAADRGSVDGSKE